MSIRQSTANQIKLRDLLEVLRSYRSGFQHLNRILSVFASPQGEQALWVLTSEGFYTTQSLVEKLECTVNQARYLSQLMQEAGVACEVGRFIVVNGPAVAVYALPDTPPEEAREYLRRTIKRRGGAAVRLEDVQVLADAQRLAEEAATFWGAAIRPWETGNEKLVPRTWLLQKAADRGLYPRNWDKVRAALRRLGWGVLEGI